MKLNLIQEIIDLFRGKKKNVRIYGKNNNIFHKNSSKAKITIYGNNNNVVIKDSNEYINIDICIGTKDCYANNCKVFIDRNFNSNGTLIRLLEDDSSVIIGPDCMFSAEVQIDCSDTHSIYDIKTKKILNIGKSVKIGNHVWIGKYALICKNTVIPNNCIVGAHSVVTKKFLEDNCTIAGIPAKICRHNINWSQLRPKQYIKQFKTGDNSDE